MLVAVPIYGIVLCFALLFLFAGLMTYTESEEIQLPYTKKEAMGLL